MTACNRCFKPIMFGEVRIVQPVIGMEDLTFHLRCYGRTEGGVLETQTVKSEPLSRRSPRPAGSPS